MLKSFWNWVARNKWTVSDHRAYAYILNLQENKCAICHQAFIKIRANVDHDHTTGLVRGILCQRCNIFVGYLEKSGHLLQAAQEYIERGPIQWLR